MQYVDKFFYLCEIPLSAEEASDVVVLERADSTEDFPRIFKRFEELRAHALNKDGLYSVVRADAIFIIVRTSSNDLAKQMAFDDSRANLITNLQHRVMQLNDLNAKDILKKVHNVDMENIVVTENV
jgi:hypothetical protein